MKKKLLYLSLSLTLLVSKHSYAQETHQSSIRTGIGIGMNEGKKEMGSGKVYSIGWQRSFGTKNKLRINPNFLIGGFGSGGINDVRDNYYQVSSLELNCHYDLLRIKSTSIVTAAGPFVSVSKGLQGTGGDPDHPYSEYFRSVYYGLNLSLGIRVDLEGSRVAYDFRPITAQLGNEFVLGFMMFGIDIKLGKINP